MKKSPIRIAPACEADTQDIERLAKSFDLDCEDLSWNQFIVAKKNETLMGFGRLKNYPGCTEIATVGVIEEEQKMGVGSLLVKELVRNGPAEIFVTCVIPEFFNKLGFQMVKQYPSILQKKVDFCKSYDFNDEQVFVMKFTK